MKEEIKTLDGFAVVGLKYCGTNQNREVVRLWEAFQPRVGEIAGRVPETGAYGMMGGYSPDVPGMGHFDAAQGTFEYVASVQVDGDVALPDGMTRWEIPPATYFVYTFPFKALSAAFHYVYHTWLPESEYAFAGTPEFEHYPEGFTPGDAESEMALYVPVQRR